MANDSDANLILAELTATLRQLQQAGVPVKISDDTKGKPCIWIGLGGVHVERGAFVFDSAALLELQPQH